MTSSTALRSGLMRYKVSLAAIDEIGEKGDEKQKMLVPLTQSLYVAGQSINSSKLLLDIGTVRGREGCIFILRKQQQYQSSGSTYAVVLYQNVRLADFRFCCLLSCTLRDIMPKRTKKLQRNFWGEKSK